MSVRDPVLTGQIQVFLERDWQTVDYKQDFEIGDIGEPIYVFADTQNDVFYQIRPVVWEGRSRFGLFVLTGLTGEDGHPHLMQQVKLVDKEALEKLSDHLP